MHTLDALDFSPEEAAYLLAEQFMDSMMEESDRRTFRITEYRDLTVTVIPTLEMDEETAGIYDLAEDELVENAWIVKICAPFLYEGTLSPVGSSAGDQWIDILYQGSPVDFLMRRGGGTNIPCSPGMIESFDKVEMGPILKSAFYCNQAHTICVYFPTMIQVHLAQLR